MIVEHVWDMDYDGLTNIVDVYIRHLRSKIDDRFPVKLIQTVRGIGYMIEAPEKPAETAAGGLMSLLSSGRFKIAGTPAPSLNTRAVRFRLTAFYALITSLMLILVGAFYRQRLAANLDTQIHDGLEQEWAAAHGYLRIEDDQVPIWYYDRKDPDESYIVERLKRVYMLADAHGNVMQISEAYQLPGRRFGCRDRRHHPRAAASMADTQERPGCALSDPSRRDLRRKA